MNTIRPIRHMSVQRALATLGLVAAATATGTRANACPQTPLPVLDCAVDPSSVCCTGASLFDDATNPPSWNGGNNLCAEALVSSLVANDCNAQTLAKHDILYHIDLEDGATGANSCDGSMDYGKHYNAGQLIPTMIDYKPGITWHHPVSDYYRAALAESNEFHAEFEHFFGHNDPDGTANARHTQDFVGKDNIELFCPLFGMTASGSPLYRASDFIHESWHDTYGGHDSDDPDRDDYAYHNHILGVGQMNGDTVDHSQDQTPEDFLRFQMSSVYQVHYEFLCDVNTTPQDWVPRSLAWEAGAIADDFLLKKYDDDGGAFNSPPPMTCNNAPPARRNPDVPEITNGRVIKIQIHADIHETDAPIGGPTDEPHGTTITMTLTPDNPIDDKEWISPRVDDQVWVEYFVHGELQPDGETVILSYDMLMFETNADLDRDCEESLSTGKDCPAGPRRTMTLDSTNFSPVPVVFNLDNSQSWSDPDRASGSIVTTMEW
jgi:hypothetical protein